MMTHASRIRLANVMAGTLVASALLVAPDAPAHAQSDRQLVLGGGSSFAAPIFNAWIEAFEQQDPTLDVEYDSIGSGEGINRFVLGALDFAATDAPLTSETEAQIEGGVSHVPVTAGMIAVAYHLPDELEGELRLPRDVLGDIFAGRISSWDDPRIADANPALDLPKRSIVVVGRLDNSGTTYAFTNHLNAISETWSQAGLGAVQRVDWPGNAMLGRGNEGVAAQIIRGYGTIGYVEYGFASRLGLPMAQLENAAGQFVGPTADAGTAAIETAPLPADLKIELPDPPGDAAYPIVTFTFALLRDREAATSKGEAVRRFIGWTLDDGQALAPDLGYVRLPGNVQKAAEGVLSTGG